MKTINNILTFGLTTVALGMPAIPGHIPGDRLVSNLTEKLKKDPGNAAIYYLIGRAHYATFSRAVETSWAGKGEVEIFDMSGGLPSFYTTPGNIYPWDSRRAVEDTADNRRHITEAVRNLSVAIDMTDHPTKRTSVYAESALAHLTLACTFDSGALLASQITLSKPYQDFRTTSSWRSQASKEYLIAYQKAIVQDVRREDRPLFGLRTLVAYEAGKSFLRLSPNTKEAQEVKRGLEKLDALPSPHMVTPIILDLGSPKPLSDLLSSKKWVPFDLDGTGRAQTYRWVKPTTAFLVWDPQHEGRITSGRQLFGNATWWMLWNNGYAALDALDNNRDGWLSGNELHGLALWYDRNGNGKCDPGEVISIEQTGIVALRTRFDGKSGASFVSQSGVVLKDGRTLPTYDWVVKAK